MALTLTSPDLFDRIIDVEFLGESFQKTEKKLDVPREVTLQEYNALCTKYTQPASGNVIVMSPKIISKKSDEGPFTISTEIEEVQLKRTICKLECGHGIKPQMSLSFRMLPGQLVYHVILKITNLELPFDIRDCTSMKIKAGYRDDRLIQSFTMGVFASYTESPGPDDITVFEGVIVDSLDNFFTTRKVQIDLNESSTVDGLLGALERYLPGPRTFGENSLSSKTGVVSSTLQIHREVEPEVLALPISLGDHSKTFDNGYQALSWAVGIIQDAVKNQKTSDGNPVQIFASVFNTDIIIMDTAHKGADSKLTTVVGVPVINNIKRASFTGPRLTLIAAWFPPLIPGKIFEMEPNFFNGHRLNNDFDPSIWKTETNTYRVITMEVNFDTVGKQNEMIIEALPTDEGGLTEEIASKIKAGDIDASVKRYVNQPEGEGTIRVLQTGDGGTVKNVTDLGKDAPPPRDEKYDVVRAEQIEIVATTTVWLGVRLSVPYEKELYKKLKKLKDGVHLSPGASAESDQPMCEVDSSILWPLIYISTYRAMKAGMPGYFVLTDSGGNIEYFQSVQCCQVGNEYGLYIPKMPKSGDYKSALSPFKNMADDIKKLAGQTKYEYTAKNMLMVLYELLESI